MHEIAKTGSDILIVWRAYELRPDPVPTLPPKGDYLQKAWKNSVYPLAQRVGIVMRLPPVQPRTRLAHQAAHWAREQGRFDEYHEGLFTALFERGEDIGQVEVLKSLASSLGMDAQSLDEALAARKFEPSVLADEELAARLGIRGVPAFVANRAVATTGVQPSSELRRLIEKARGIQPPMEQGFRQCSWRHDPPETFPDAVRPNYR